MLREKARTVLALAAAMKGNAVPKALRVALLDEAWSYEVAERPVIGRDGIV